jgi:hypothetical protein
MLLKRGGETLSFNSKQILVYPYISEHLHRCSVSDSAEENWMKKSQKKHARFDSAK